MNILRKIHNTITNRKKITDITITLTEAGNIIRNLPIDTPIRLHRASSIYTPGTLSREETYHLISSHPPLGNYQTHVHHQTFRGRRKNKHYLDIHTLPIHSPAYTVKSRLKPQNTTISYVINDNQFRIIRFPKQHHKSA